MYVCIVLYCIVLYCMYVCMYACIYVFRHSPYMVKQRVNPKKDVQKTSDGT